MTSTNTERLHIGELSQLTGVSPRSLRHYEKVGLLAAERLPNGYRTYPPGAVAQVKNIKLLLDAGFTLDDAAVILPCVETTAQSARINMCPVVAARVRQVIASIDEKTSELASQRHAIAVLAQPGNRC